VRSLEIEASAGNVSNRASLSFSRAIGRRLDRATRVGAFFVSAIAVVLQFADGREVACITFR